MVAVITTQEFLAGAQVLSGVLTAHLPPSFSDLTLNIICPAFEGNLALPIIEIDSQMESGAVVVRSAVDPDSTVVLVLNGVLSNEHDKFEIQRVGLDVETTAKLAHSDFVISSLRAMLTLSSHVYLQIPEIQLDLDLSFDAPLLEISDMLRRRQIAYRIMVIEGATKCEFDLPPSMSGEEVESIALAYHAIIERTFDWQLDQVTVSLSATEECLSRIIYADQFTTFTLGPDPISKSIFGKHISLGSGTLTVLDKFIEEFDRIKLELARNDGHEVVVTIRSLAGRARYDLPNAPRLRANPWKSQIKGLVDLEAQLDSELVGRYHALAASTLEGLSEQEKTDITTRPEAGEAFLINDSHVENI